jgi:hypothetical protein
MLITCMMGICTICMATTSMNIRLKCHRPIPTDAHPNTAAALTIGVMCMDLVADTKPFRMAITWTTSSKGTFIILMAIIATTTAR